MNPLKDIFQVIFKIFFNSEIFGYMLNGLPQTYKAALHVGIDHALVSSHLVRLNIFKIVWYNKTML